MNKEMKNNFFVLRPSAIEGIGVVTDYKIKKNEKMYLWGSNNDIRMIRYPKGKERSMCIRFCVEVEPNIYCCPRSFNQMSIGWYLNHSDNPNAAITDKYAIALRMINKGEEITIDYNTLSRIPNINP
jgi:hypothetical protein